MADINLNIALSIQEATKQIEKFTSDSAKSLNSFSKQADQASKSLLGIEKNTSIAAQAVATAIGVTAVNAIAAASDAAQKLFNTFVVQGVKAYQEQEDAIVRLNSALAAQGELTRESQQSLIDQANALQQTTKFSDDAVLGVQALVANLTDLDVNGIKAVTASALDLSTALGIDVETAASLVSKAIEGNTGALKRYGIEVKTGTTQAETLANVLGALNQRFGGASADAVNTFSGAIAKVRNAFGDLQEETGSLIASNPAVIAAIAQFGQFFDGLKQIVIENQDAIKAFISQIVIFASNIVPLAVKGIAQLDSFFTRTIQTFSDGANAIDKVASKINNFLGFDNKSTQEQIENYDKITLARAQDLENRQAVFAEIAALADQSVAKIEEAATRETEIANTKFQSDQERFAIQKELAAQRAAEEDLKRQESLQKEINDLMAHNQNLATISQTRNAEEIARNKQRIDQILRDNEFSARRQAEIEAKITAQKRAELNARLDGTRTFFSGLASLTQTGNKTLFEIGKAAAYANAVVSGAQAFMNALANVPYPFNLLAAAGIAVQTGVQLAVINAQGLATGMTEIPPGFNNDTFPAMLTSGERVISTPQNQDLKSFMEEERGSRTILMSIADRLDQALNRPIVIEINGREVFKAVNDELQNGRAFAV